MSTMISKFYIIKMLSMLSKFYKNGSNHYNIKNKVFFLNNTKIQNKKGQLQNTYGRKTHL